MRFHNSEMCHFENESHADRNGSPVQTPFQPALDEKFEDQKSLCRDAIVFEDFSPMSTYQIETCMSSRIPVAAFHY